MEVFFEILSILLLAGTKMAFAPPLALKLGYSVFQTSLITSIGGILGVCVFYFLGKLIQVSWRHFMTRFFHKTSKPKRFSKMARFIVFVRKKAGLPGLILITPTIISIPIGTIIIHQLYSKNKAALPYLFVSVVLWAFALTPVWNWILTRSVLTQIAR